MPSPSAAAAASREAAPASVLDGFSAAVTDASPRPSTNLVWPCASRPLAMSSTTGRPGSATPTAASVPGDLDRRAASRRRGAAGRRASPTAAREQRRVLGGDHDRRLEFEQAARRWRRCPPEPIQLGEVALRLRRFRAPSAPQRREQAVEQPFEVERQRRAAGSRRRAERAAERGERLQAARRPRRASRRRARARRPATSRRAVRSSAVRALRGPARAGQPVEAGRASRRRRVSASSAIESGWRAARCSSGGAGSAAPSRPPRRLGRGAGACGGDSRTDGRARPPARPRAASRRRWLCAQRRRRRRPCRSRRARPSSLPITARRRTSAKATPSELACTATPR